MIAAITNAVQSAIAAKAANSPFSQPLTATVEYLPVDDLDQLQGVKVYVVPSSLNSEQFARNAEQREYAVDVAISKKLQADDRTSGAWRSELNNMLGLVEEIGVYLRFQPMAGGDWKGAQIAPIYDAKRLRDTNVFLSVLRVTYWMSE